MVGMRDRIRDEGEPSGAAVQAELAAHPVGIADAATAPDPAREDFGARLRLSDTSHRLPYPSLPYRDRFCERGSTVRGEEKTGRPDHQAKEAAETIVEVRGESAEAATVD